MELRSLDYKFGGRNAVDTKKEGNDLNKEIGVTREVRVTTLNDCMVEFRNVANFDAVWLPWWRRGEVRAYRAKKSKKKVCSDYLFENSCKTRKVTVRDIVMEGPIWTDPRPEDPER